MGLWKVLFRSDSGGGSVKVRQSAEDNAKIRADRITSTKGEKHIHESYTLDTESGSYKQYGGGENAPDRSYNKE